MHLCIFLFQTLHFNCLSVDGNKRVNQSVPIALPVTTEDKNRLENSHAVALYHDDVCYAIIRQPEVYYQRKEERVARQFGTTNKNHPYIKVSSRKDVIEVIKCVINV